MSINSISEKYVDIKNGRPIGRVSENVPYIFFFNPKEFK